MIFEYKNFELSYEKWGIGKNVLIAFHGFGQDETVFRNISSALEERFTVYSFSLFYHGNSKFPSDISAGTPIPPFFLVEGLKEFCNREDIKHLYVLGYSLGGRVALTFIELIPERILGAILLAPDGIKKSFWYYFATQNIVGKLLFRRVVKKPNFLFRLILLFNKLRLVNDKMIKFVYSQFSEEEKRIKVMNVWNTYSKIMPSLSKVKKNIHTNTIPTLIFTGDYDPVLDKKIGEILQKDLHHRVKWVKMKAGHDLLKPHYSDQIKGELDWIIKHV